MKSDWAAGFPWEQWKEPHLHFPAKLELYSNEPEEEWRPVIRKESFRDELHGFKAKDLFARYFEKLRTEIRKKHYSLRTERNCWGIRLRP